MSDDDRSEAKKMVSDGSIGGTRVNRLDNDEEGGAAELRDMVALRGLPVATVATVCGGD